MDSDLRKTELKITSDPRLRAAVRGALECVCERRGLPKPEQHELADAVEKECSAELHDPQQSGCYITINESDDRIEVKVTPAHANGARGSGIETNVALSGASGKQHGGSSRRPQNGAAGATFVKRLHKKPAHS